VARLRVHNFTISLDGFAAGPRQDLEHPLGDGGLQLHEWIFRTRSFRELQGRDGGEAGLGDDLFRARTAGVGATIMGRNMFGPVRGPWPDESWRGWWGEDPPFGHDVFVLTRHPRSDLAMRNGTTFRFVDASPHEVLDMAMRAASGQDVVLGGGPATIRQFLAAGLVDEMHLAIAPVLLGEGERLFGHLPTGITGYSCCGLTCSAGIAHARITRTPETGSKGPILPAAASSHARLTPCP
jgi:dihydrofolate reductase